MVLFALYQTNGKATLWQGLNQKAKDVPTRRHAGISPFMITWWRHQMETFSVLLALCAGNSPVTVISPRKGQWRGAFMLSLICTWMNGWVNNREAGDLRRQHAHHDVTVMLSSRTHTSWIISAWAGTSGWKVTFANTVFKRISHCCNQCWHFYWTILKGINVSDILIKIQKVFFKKMHLKMFLCRDFVQASMWQDNL